jgi:hypothetical protein
MSEFNADAFLSGEYDEAFSTQDPEIPANEYTGIIEKITPRQITPRDGGESKLLIMIDWAVDDETVRQIVGRDKVVAQQKLWLDTEPNGTLSTGKGRNAQLGRLRAAVDQNRPGKKWSWSMLLGQVATIKVVSEAGTDEYEGRYFYRVMGVTKK